MQIWLIGSLHPGRATQPCFTPANLLQPQEQLSLSFPNHLNKTHLILWAWDLSASDQFYGVCNSRILCPSLQTSIFLSMTYPTSRCPGHREIIQHIAFLVLLSGHTLSLALLSSPSFHSGVGGETTESERDRTQIWRK